VFGGSAIRKATIDAGKDWYQVDHGYFGRWAYFRATKNAATHNKIRKVPSDRWRSFHAPIEPWKTGSHILICRQSSYTYSFFDEEDWEAKMVSRLKELTDRPIKFRDKGIGGISEMLRGAHAVVTYSSAAALDALIYGVPAFSVCAPSKPIEDPLEQINDPSRPEREPLLWSAAYGQFTQDEMRSGYARTIIESDHDIL